MIIFTDILTGDEFFSDAYEPKEVGNGLVEVDCQTITVKAGADVDIGANPSAEEADEGLEEGMETVNNVVYSFRLQPTNFDKKTYMGYIKGYFKDLKKKLQESKSEEEIAAFEKEAQAGAKKILGSFKDYEFYTGESMDPSGMVALLNYRSDGVTPYFTFFKDGLKQTKV
ncbi:unnamed protein product [Cunninghamella blakesleeana]